MVHQPVRGFRYAMDPFLLAGFALEGGPIETALDAGTGSGIAALLLARQGVQVLGIDVRPEWVALAWRSATDSGLTNARFEVADVRQGGFEPVDVAICNPPYLPAGRGALPADPMKAHARHELAGTAPEMAGAMCAFAPRVCLVVARVRDSEICEALRAAGHQRQRVLRFDDALSLIEGTPGEPALEIETAALRDGPGHGPRVHALYERICARLRPSGGPQPLPKAPGASS